MLICITFYIICFAYSNIYRTFLYYITSLFYVLYATFDCWSIAYTYVLCITEINKINLWSHPLAYFDNRATSSTIDHIINSNIELSQCVLFGGKNNRMHSLILFTYMKKQFMIYRFFSNANFLQIPSVTDDLRADKQWIPRLVLHVSWFLCLAAVALWYWEYSSGSGNMVTFL